MKYLAWYQRGGLLSVFTLLFLLVLNLSVALAGGVPSDSGSEPAPSAESVEPAESAESVEPVESVERTQAPAETAEHTYRSASGLVIGINGGISIVSDADFSAPATEFQGFEYGPLEGTVGYGGGYSLNFMVGYAFENGLRIGADIVYTGNNCYKNMNVTMPGTLVTQVGLDSGNNPCLAGTDGCIPYSALEPEQQELLMKGSTGKKKIKGKSTAFAFMLSAYYDLDFGSDLVPYVGGALGGASISSEVESDEGVTKGNLLLDDSDYALVYQVGAGLGYKINSILGLDNDLMVTFDYRYLASMQDLEFQGSLTGGSVESEFGGHYVGGGIRLGL